MPERQRRCLIWMLLKRSSALRKLGGGIRAANGVRTRRRPSGFTSSVPDQDRLSKWSPKALRRADRDASDISQMIDESSVVKACVGRWRRVGFGPTGKIPKGPPDLG